MVVRNVFDLFAQLPKRAFEKTCGEQTSYKRPLSAVALGSLSHAKAITLRDNVKRYKWLCKYRYADIRMHIDRQTDRQTDRLYIIHVVIWPVVIPQRSVKRGEKDLPGDT